MTDKTLLNPVGHDRHGPIYSPEQVTQTVALMIHNGDYFKRRSKAVSQDYEQAQELVNKASAQLDHALQHLQEQEAKLAASTKKVSGQVRDATQKLSDGLNRIEKIANFDRLARYADLLERIEKSVSSLAELERVGILNRVGQALK